MKYIKIGIFIIVLSLLLMPLRVYAEDEPIDEPIIEEELEQSPIAKFYEEKIRPHGITMLTAFLGTAGGGYGLYTVLRMFLKRKIDTAIDKLALSQEQTQMLKGMNEQLLQKADELVETKLKQALDKIDEYAKLTLDLLEENKQLTDIVNRLTQIVNDTLIKTDNKFDKIAKVLEIAFTNDKDLVRNGYAQAIEKVLEQAQPLVNEVLANVEE